MSRGWVLLAAIVVIAAWAATVPPQPIQHPGLEHRFYAADQRGPPIPNQQTVPSREASQNQGNAAASLGTSATNPVYVQTNCEHGCGYAESNEGWWKKLWTDPVATFTALLFLSTGLLWWVTRQSLKHAEKSSERQLRAYVSVRPSALRNFAVGKRPEMAYFMLNAGQTPAYKLVHGAIIRILPIPIPIGTAVNVDLSRDHAFVLHPTEDGKYAGMAEADFELTAEDYSAVTQGEERALYLIGEVQYQDAFDKPHVTEFCTAIGGGSLVQAFTVQQRNMAPWAEIVAQYVGPHNKAT